MGKEKRGWRKLVKKLRRKRHRQKSATEESEVEIIEDTGLIQIESTDSVLDDNSQIDNPFFLSQNQWEDREVHLSLVACMKQAQEDRLERARLEHEQKIREEWEEKERLLKEEKAEKERIEKERLKKQASWTITTLRIFITFEILNDEEEYNQFLGFLCGDIKTPPVPYIMPEDYTDTGQDVCNLFVKTGACRFYDRCKLAHPTPVLSQTILIPNFFSHFSLEESLRDEYDTDLGLEYEKSDLHKEFLEFYADVLPEFRKHGNVIQFKVCCNLEPHLRGNVYIQYDNIRNAVEAFRTFNARYYNGKQISLRFVKIDSWNVAICWSFFRRHCVKGRTCSYLHVFRNPTKEFVSADRDWKELPLQRISSTSTHSSSTKSTREPSEPRNKNANTSENVTKPSKIYSTNSRVADSTSSSKSTHRSHTASSNSSRPSRDRSRSHRTTSRERRRSKSRSRSKKRRENSHNPEHNSRTASPDKSHKKKKHSTHKKHKKSKKHRGSSSS